MINAWWLIPAAAIGCFFGMVLMAIMASNKLKE